MKLMKFDAEKSRVELIQPEFILGIGEILGFGAKKYKKNNWMNASEEDLDRYLGAALRHILAYMNGEKIDPESGKSHLYHLGCNAMFLDYFDRKELNERKKQQRSKVPTKKTKRKKKGK
jgi:hypothetical protein